MIKKTLLVTFFVFGFSTAYANDLNCGPKEQSVQNQFLGEVKTKQNSFFEQVKTQADKPKTKQKNECDDHCEDKKNCTEHKDHDCNETCNDHKNHKH